MIIVVFLNSSTQVIVEDTNMTNTSKSVLSLKNTLDKLYFGWNKEFQIIKKPDNFDSVLFMKTNLESGFLFWVVDLGSKKLKSGKTFWQNYLWYKKLSKTELEGIFSNSWSIYDKEFQKDKIFEIHTIKNFEAKVFTGEVLKKDVLEIDFQIIKTNDENLTGQDLNNLNVPLNKYNYNLVF